MLATDMATIALNDVVANKIRIAAAQQGTAQAEANKNKALGELGAKSSALLEDASGRLGTLKTGEDQSTGTPPSHGELGITPLLHPGAEHSYKGLMRTPKAKDHIQEIGRQFTQAQQADKILATLPATFSSLSQEAKEGSVGGYARRKGASVLSQIPMVGSAIAGATTGFATDIPVNRAYDSDKTALVGDISAALKGTNVSGDQIQKIVDDNSPEYGDTPELLAKKQRAIESFIKKHVETSMLKTWHLTNE